MPAASEIPQSVDIQKHLSAMHLDAWLKDDVFTFRWWLLLSLIIISLVLWWLMLDKSRLKELLLFTALGVILSLGLHEYGEELIFWDYPTDIIPFFPPLSSIDLLILPLSYSLAYQYWGKRRPYIKAVLIITAIVCFMIEPLLARIGLYQLLNWQYYYSYPLFLALALSLRYITMLLIRLTEKGRREKGGASCP